MPKTGRKTLYKHGTYRMYIPLPQDFALAFKTMPRLRKRVIEEIRKRWGELPWDDGPVDLGAAGFGSKQGKRQPSASAPADDPQEGRTDRT